MELRILVYQSRKKLASICGHYFCYLKDDIQYKLPYLVRYGQLKSVFVWLPGKVRRESHNLRTS